MDSDSSRTHSSTTAPPSAFREKTSGLLLLLFCAGCVSTGEMPEHATIHGPLPQDIRSVVVQAMPMKPEAIKNVEKLTPADATAQFAGYLQDALAQKQPAWQIKLADERGTPSDQDLTIATELLEIDGGSAALRFWIGLNTGGVQSKVKVSIAGKTGDIASANISERTVCPAGACTESTEAMVQRNLKNLAADVAEFIVDPAGYEKKKAAKPKA